MQYNCNACPIWRRLLAHLICCAMARTSAPHSARVGTVIGRALTLWELGVL